MDLVDEIQTTTSKFTKSITKRLYKYQIYNKKINMDQNFNILNPQIPNVQKYFYPIYLSTEGLFSYNVIHYHRALKFLLNQIINIAFCKQTINTNKFDSMFFFQ